MAGRRINAEEAPDEGWCVESKSNQRCRRVVVDFWRKEGRGARSVLVDPQVRASRALTAIVTSRLFRELSRDRWSFAITHEPCRLSEFRKEGEASLSGRREFRQQMTPGAGAAGGLVTIQEKDGRRVVNPGGKLQAADRRAVGHGRIGRGDKMESVTRIRKAMRRQVGDESGVVKTRNCGRGGC